jgi:hypothetical protein
LQEETITRLPRFMIQNLGSGISFYLFHKNDFDGYLVPDNNYVIINSISTHTNCLIQSVKELPKSLGLAGLSQLRVALALIREANYTWDNHLVN